MRDSSFPGTLECRRLSPQWRQGLAEFGRALTLAGDTALFNPHPFTDNELDQRVQYTGPDLYYVVVEHENVLAYGMLRGWEAGFSIPSLGIAVHPAARACGIGTALMLFLHVAATRRGAERVRLKVMMDNLKAIDLYRRLGYRFESSEGSYYVGFKELRRPAGAHDAG